MESYIIKIYRQEKQKPEKAVGIAENVTTGKRTVFSNGEELWRFINSNKQADEEREN